jgi:hypothetical protein
MNDWPDSTRPGVPLRPEHDGWHWLHDTVNKVTMPAFWDAEYQSWHADGLRSPKDFADFGFRYRGRCLLPEEVEELLAKQIRVDPGGQ